MKPSPFYKQLQKAVKIAAKAHRGQERDGDHPLPYITHPIDVLNRVRYDAGVTDEDVLCAAVLHDLLEETDIELSDIDEDFGPRVAGLVKQLTRLELLSEERARLTELEIWKKRTELLLHGVSQMSNEAKIIKLADRCSNLFNALKTREGDKLYRYIRQSEMIRDSIDRSVSPPLWDQIQAMIDSVALPEEYKTLTI